MPLYLVAILTKPNAKELETGVKERLILAPSPVVAVDGSAAAAVAVQQYKVTEDLANTCVIVKAFTA